MGGATGLGLNQFSSREDGDKVRIVTHRSGDEPAKTETVPKKWYSQLKAARREKEKLASDLLEEGNVKSIGIGAGDASIDGHRLKSIKISLEKDAGVAVAESVGTDHDIPVEIEGVHSEFILDGHTEETQNLQGGMGIGMTDEENTGTLCCRVERNNNYQLLTARHVTTQGNICSGPDPTGDDVFASGDNFGEVIDDSPELDASLISFDENGDIPTTRASIVSQYGGLKGVITQDGWDIKVGSDDLDFYGSVTGHDTTTPRQTGVSFTIQRRDDQGNVICSQTLNNIVLNDVVGQSGDSGAPVYDVQSHFLGEDLYMGNIHSGRITVNNNSRSWGAAGYALANEFNASFDTRRPYY